LDAYAAKRGARRQDVLVSAVEAFKADCEGGVPELRNTESYTRPRVDPNRSADLHQQWAMERQRKLNREKGM